MRQGLVAGAAVLLTLPALSCAPEAGPGGWVRIDLWRETSAPRARSLAPLVGAKLDGSPRRRTKAPSGDLRVLRIPEGKRLEFELELGSEPYLSFRPLVPGTASCPVSYRVEARETGGEWTSLFEQTVTWSSWFASADRIVDLGAYSDRAMQLALSVPKKGPVADCPVRRVQSLWGSPGVYFRSALGKPGPLGRALRGRKGTAPNVLLVSLDALRADALGAYGAEPSVTPALDELGRESDVWLRAYSTFNGTNPSFASILTGFYGKNHGIYDLETPLAGRHETLAELLGRAGYATHAIVSARHLAGRFSGLDQGFGDYLVPERLRSAELSTDLALEWLAEQDRPWFLWLHLYDPHVPHTPPENYALGFAHEHASGLSPAAPWKPFREPGPVSFRLPGLGGHEALYSGEVAYLDRQIDRLVGFLRSWRMLQDTLLVVVSDHGENLTEHGLLFNHAGLWDTTTHVPLLVRWPGRVRAGRRLEGLAQTLDVFATVLAATGVDGPPTDSRDLATWTTAPQSGRRLVFAEHMNGMGTMVRSRKYLYVASNGPAGQAAGGHLHDLARDPEQTVNLVETRPDLAADFDRLLEAWLAERRVKADGTAEDAGQPGTPSRRDRQLLEALGYLDG